MGGNVGGGNVDATAVAATVVEPDGGCADGSCLVAVLAGVGKGGQTRIRFAAPASRTSCNPRAVALPNGGNGYTQQGLFWGKNPKRAVQPRAANL